MLSNFVLATSFAHTIKENDNNQRKWFSANELSTKWKNHFWVELNSFKLINTFCLLFADINECETGKHHGDSRAFCDNTKGLYNCTCKPGYFGNGFNCTGNYRSNNPDSKNLILTWKNLEWTPRQCGWSNQWWRIPQSHLNAVIITIL